MVTSLENLKQPDVSLDSTEEKHLHRNVISLGWVAFFGGLAQDMIQPILPTFYTSVLGLNKEFIGLIEGSLTTVVSLMKIGAGYLSDALGVRKIILLYGSQPSISWTLKDSWENLIEICKG
jgi:MFS family permease